MKRLSAYLVVGVIALLGIVPAQAQDTDRPFDAMDALGWHQLSLQLTASLDSPVAQVRQEAMQHIIFFATHYSDQMSLDDAIPKLVDVYDTNRDEGYRILALTSLHAIGHPDTMKHLKRSVQREASPRVRRLTMAALADYATRADTIN